MAPIVIPTAAGALRLEQEGQEPSGRRRPSPPKHRTRDQSTQTRDKPRVEKLTPRVVLVDDGRTLSYLVVGRRRVLAVATDLDDAVLRRGKQGLGHPHPQHQHHQMVVKAAGESRRRLPEESADCAEDTASFAAAAAAAGEEDKEEEAQHQRRRPKERRQRRERLALALGSGALLPLSNDDDIDRQHVRNPSKRLARHGERVVLGEDDDDDDPDECAVVLRVGCGGGPGTACLWFARDRVLFCGDLLYPWTPVDLTRRGADLSSYRDSLLALISFLHSLPSSVRDRTSLACGRVSSSLPAYTALRDMLALVDDILDRQIRPSVTRLELCNRSSGNKDDDSDDDDACEVVEVLRFDRRHLALAVRTDDPSLAQAAASRGFFC